MWLVFGAICTAAACVWYPVDGAQHRTEEACMGAISALHDKAAGFGPYTTLRADPESC